MKFGKKIRYSTSRAHKLERMFAFGLIHGEDDPENPGGGGGGKEDDKTFTQADVDKMLQERLEKETGGLKTKNKELLDKMKALDPVRQTLERLGGSEELEGLLEFKSKIEKDEILKLASEGKHQEAIDKALEKTNVTHSAEKKKLNETIEEYKTRTESLNRQLGKLLVDGAVTRNFVNEKGLDSAIDDVILRANSVFKVEDGEVVARNEKGELVEGENGPLTMEEWVKGLKQKAPHLFPSSEGGLGGGGSGGGSGDNDGGRMAAVKKGPAEYRKWKQAQAAKRQKAAEGK